MNKGKEKCNLLKGIRKAVADKYGLNYNPSKCTNNENCRGTCPMCESELNDLQNQLIDKNINKISQLSIFHISENTDIRILQDVDQMNDGISPDDLQNSLANIEEIPDGMVPGDDILGLNGDDIIDN